MHLSALLIHSGRYREALEECGLLAEDPTFPAPWRALHNCGHAYLELGELQEARDSFEQALAYGVDFWEATLSLGILAKREGRREEALERFREVLDRNPGASATSEVHYHLGEVYVSLGQRQQALAHLDDSITAAPRGVWADRSEAYRELIR